MSLNKCIPISRRAVEAAMTEEGEGRPVWEALASLPWGDDLDPIDHIGGEAVLRIERAIEDYVLEADATCLLRWVAPTGTDSGELQLFTRTDWIVLFPER